MIDRKTGDRNSLTFKSTGLSKDLASGKISPVEVLQTIKGLKEGASTQELDYLNAVERQLYFREFARHALEVQRYKQPSPVNEFQKEWEALKKGQSGIPIIDAAVKDLYTGTPHNRARLLLARYAIRTLNRDPEEVARWFAENLADYDPVINTFNIVSSASGATFGEPYYRKSNPLSAQKTLPNAKEYIQQYLGDEVYTDPQANQLIDKGYDLWRKRWKNKDYESYTQKKLWPTKDPVKGKYIFTPQQVKELNLPVKGKFSTFYQKSLSLET